MDRQTDKQTDGHAMIAYCPQVKTCTGSLVMTVTRGDYKSSRNQVKSHPTHVIPVPRSTRHHTRIALD